MKLCSRCRQDLPVDQFGVDRRQPDGKNIWCKPCRRQLDRDRAARRTPEQMQRDREVAAAWAARNPERVAGYRAKHVPSQTNKRRADSEKSRADNRRWYWGDIERSRQQKRSQYAKHKDKFAERANQRQRGLSAHPVFDREFDEFVFQEARALARMRGPGWEIDHIVPLKHGEACGLHNGFNIQVVPKAWNRSKGNRRIESSPPIVDIIP
jgi:hypothetical protein